MNQHYKKLIYRATKRGTKENEIILGGFVKRHGQTLTTAQFQDLDALLDCLDTDIAVWLRDPDTVPEAYDTEVFLENCERNGIKKPTKWWVIL